jgi:hypothetical protein
MEAGNLESKPKEVIQLATPLLPNIGTRRRDGISAMAAEEADHAEALRRIQEAEQTVDAIPLLGMLSLRTDIIQIKLERARRGLYRRDQEL